MRKFNYYAACVLAISPIVSTFALAKDLPQFQCMSLAHLWSGQGPMPLPVKEYASPDPGAAQIGTAMSTVVVDRPMAETSGRVRVVRPNGQIAWLNKNDITSWHVVSNPNAQCSVVQLPNGRIGTSSR